MINRVHRFHGYASLRKVYQTGQTIRGPLLSLKFILNDRRQTYRCAVVVSRKVSKSAVKRNRIRRRLYEIVRQQESAITKPYDLVFIICSEQLANLAPDKIDKVVKSLLSQAKIITSSDAPSSVL